MVTLDISNIINLMLFLATLVTAIINFCFIRKEHWFTVYFVFNRRYAEIRCQFPVDILSDSFDVSKLKNEGLMKLMQRYFDLCSEEFYLKEKKK